MQDLGRIVIDINEKGSSQAEGISGIGKMNAAESELESAASAAEEIAVLAEMAGVASAAFAAASMAFGMLVKAVGEVGKALMALNQFVMEVASDLRDYSPGIQLAEMQNQLAMVNTKFRMGMQYGGAIGAQMTEVGRIERAFVEIKSAFGGIGAVFLRPITKMVADIADVLKDSLPSIIEFLAKVADAIAEMFKNSSAATDMATWLGSKLGMPSLLGLGLAGGIFSAKMVQVFTQMGIDLRAIKHNTDPKIDYSKMNEPFLSDLRLMGVKGI